MINRITNQNKLVEKKVNYFLDCLNHAISYIGWQSHLEMETPTSLIDKILFRLTQDKEYRLEYLDNYLKDPFFAGDDIWGKYSTFPDIKAVAASYNQLSKKQRQEKINLIDSSTFQNNLKQLLRDLSHSMPEDLMNAMVGNFLCAHQLDDIVPESTETHAESFASGALLLASEYLYRGYTKSEIREIVSNVFSKDEYAFPFPAEVKTRSQRRKHLAQSTLKNQLHGFANAFELKPYTNIIIVKVYGGKFPDDFEFQYNKVKFFGKRHPFILKIESKMQKDDIPIFFDSNDYILGSTEVSGFSHSSQLDNLKNILRQELVFLSAVLDRDFTPDTTQNYLYFGRNMKYRGLAWSSRKFDNPLSNNSLEKLNDNGYKALRGVKGQAVDWFLSCESLFIYAHKNESLSDYWLYLETLLSFNRKEKEVKKIVSTILLNNEIFIRNKRILEALLGCFGNFLNGPRLLNVDVERWKKIWMALKKGKIAKEIRVMDYPFVQELVKEYDSAPNANYYKKAKDYYYRMITEAYEYRNSHVHKGFTNNKSKIKLTTTLPNMVVRLRWILFRELKKGTSMPFDLLLNKLVRDGETLL